MDPNFEILGDEIKLPHYGALISERTSIQMMQNLMGTNLNFETLRGKI